MNKTNKNNTPKSKYSLVSLSTTIKNGNRKSRGKGGDNWGKKTVVPY
jgi:hypothetical protein